MGTSPSDIPVHQPRAFVVDDSQIARYILSCELERLGYEVETADTAESALRRIGVLLPDVIFMDHLLPGMDGLEAIRRLRGQPATSQLPIVMYTSQDGEDFAQRARAIGADDIYVKTAKESQLQQILTRLSLLPNRPATANTTGNVTPLRPNAAPAREQGPTISREQLARLLEPSLEAHHTKLRQELLGEFAILERYEERMRRDLLARVETASRQTNQQLDRAARAERAECKRRDRRLALVAAIFAASMLLLNAVQHVFDVRDSYVPDTHEASAAKVLVDEFQSVGIYGPVRVETSAGAFCVAATASGPTLVSTYGPLQSCEFLPVQVIATNTTP